MTPDYKIIDNPKINLVSSEQLLAERNQFAQIMHPAEFDIYNPHVIVNSNKSEITDVFVQKVFNYFMIQNHVIDRDTYKYAIPFDYLGNSVEQRNIARDFERVSNKLSSTSIYLNESDLKKFFPNSNTYGVSARFTLFPNVIIDRDNRLLIFEINPKIKEMFVNINRTGFIKGNSNTLNEVSVSMNNLYWVLRKLQKIKRVHDIKVSDFKELLHLDGKYKDFRNFKRRYLDQGVETFENDWVSFKWQVIKRGGKGGGVKEIRIAFKRGPEDERKSPVGHGAEWEEALLKINFTDTTILKFREFIAIQKKDFGKYSSRDFIWTNGYIIYSLEAARMNWEKYKNKIKDPGAWMYDALLNGKFLEYVELQPAHITDLR